MKVEDLNIGEIITATAAGLVGIGAGKEKGGKIDTGIKVKTNTKDDTLILVNKTETILTKEHVTALGGPAVMRKIGVPGYANGGLIGTIPAFQFQTPSVQPASFSSNEIQSLIKSINQKTDLISDSVDATNKRIDRVEVYNVVNKLNIAQNQFQVINQPNKI